LINLFDIFQKLVVKSNIRPGIRYPALPDIRYPTDGIAGYLAKTVSGASLFFIQEVSSPVTKLMTRKFRGCCDDMTTFLLFC
jgi:hypothetical protein